MNSKTLVTGAGGFLGSELVRQLRHKGYSVRALLQEGERIPDFEVDDVEILRGNILEKSKLRPAVAGCEYVFHAASIYDSTPFYVKYPKRLYETNIAGAQNICEASLELGVKKLIYTSSTGAVGLRGDKKPADESIKLNRLKERSHYEKSKAEAEQVVLSFHEKGLAVVSINPSFLIGAGDHRPTPTGEIILNFLNKKYPCYFEANISFSDLKSAVSAHIQALEAGKSGERYITAMERDYSVEEFFETLEKVSGVKAPKIKIPINALAVVSLLNEAGIGLLGLKSRMRPLLSFEIVRYLRLGATYDASKARKELSFTPLSLEEALRQSVEWYKSRGYVRGN